MDAVVNAIQAEETVCDAKVNLNPKHRPSRGDSRMMRVMVIRQGGRKERQLGGKEYRRKRGNEGEMEGMRKG